MTIKITELPSKTSPSNTTIVLGVDVSSNPNQSVKIPLSEIGSGISNGNFINLTSNQYSVNDGIFMNVTTNTYNIGSNTDGKILIVDNQYVTTLNLTSQRVGYSCSIIRSNNVVTIANNGMNLRSVANSVNLASQFSSASLLCYAANTFLLSGDLI
jgi:hypothetical protein